MADALELWRADPVVFVEEVLRNPESDQPFILYAEEKEFLRRAFVLGPDGRLLHPELLFNASKKSGKTALAAMICIYAVLVLGGRHAEAFVLANDLEQSIARVFQAACRIVEASPRLAADAHVTARCIEFHSTEATITALASDYAGAAGANPTISVFDELWGYTSESSQRLWDEMVPVPTRRISCRLTVSYAGFESESALLETLCKRGLKGERVATDLYQQPGMLMYSTHELRAPWQTAEWREQMRSQLRPNAFLRLVENRWVSTESTFVERDAWAACHEQDAWPLVADTALPVFGGVDASTKRDSTARVLCAWDHQARKVRIVSHRIWQPRVREPLDFEGTIERDLLEQRERFALRRVLYDPFQMASTAQRLTAAGVPMQEFPQTMGNLTEASSNLYELINGRNIIVYHAPELDLAISRAIALESPRGIRICKEKASHKIDVVIALAQACLAAVREGQRGPVDLDAAFTVPLETALHYGFARDPRPREQRRYDMPPREERSIWDQSETDDSITNAF